MKRPWVPVATARLRRARSLGQEGTPWLNAGDSRLLPKAPTLTTEQDGSEREIREGATDRWAGNVNARTRRASPPHPCPLTIAPAASAKAHPVTYFLNQTPPSEIGPENLPPDIAPTGLLEGVGAAWRANMIEYDANARVAREVEKEQVRQADAAVGLMGEAQAMALLQERGVLLAGLAEYTSYATLRHDPKARRAILERARELAAADPTLWRDVDLTDTGAEKRVNERLAVEYRDAQVMLDAMPSGRWAADFVGATAATLTDAKRLPFLLLGGGAGGSLLKVMGREALANMAGEAASLPDQFDMAARLDIPDPDPVSQLSQAAVIGGVVGGVAEALPRALSYFLGRSRITPVPGVNPATHEIAVEVAEDAIAAGRNPLDAVQRVIDDLGWDDPRYRVDQPEARDLADVPFGDVAPPSREPLVPPAARRPAPAVPAAPEPATLTETLQAAQDGTSAAQAIPAQALPRMSRPKVDKPLTLSSFVKKRGGVWTGDPNFADLGEDIRRRPGMAKKAKQVRSSAGNNGGGLELDYLREAAVEAGYLPDGATITDLIDALRADMSGRRVYSQADMAAAQEWDAYTAARRDAERDPVTMPEPAPGTDPTIADITSMKRADDGLFFQPYDIFEELTPSPAEIRAVREKVGRYLFSRGIRDMPDDVLDEIADHLATYGGDAKYLIERATGREVDELSAAITGGNDGTARAVGGADQSGGRPAVAPQRNAATAGATGGSAGQSGGVERTSAGVQYVAPGITPVSDRARLEAAQSRPLEGGNIPMDVGLFDTGARAQMDMFSDPYSDAAWEAQGAMLRELRDTIDENGGPLVDLGESEGLRTMASLLRELDEDEAFLQVINACILRR